MHSAISWSKYPTPANLAHIELRDPSLPLVSIVTPTYNQGHFIRETIESVLAQDYPNLEYWVIDGASTDQTCTILQEYESDPRFHWLSERDRGQSDAINKGWSRCQGTILAWLNSDDVYVHPNVISQQQQLICDDTVPALVYGKAIYTDAAGKELRPYPSRQFSPYALLRACHIPQPSVFLTRQLVDRVGCIQTTLNFGMDYDYWLRCAEHCDFIYNPQPIATYRLHEDSKTVSSAPAHALESAQIVATALTYLQHKVQPHLQRKVLAGAFLQVASANAQSGNLQAALRNAAHAARYSVSDRKWLLFGLALVDHATRHRLQLEQRMIDIAHQ
ncbi:MAG: glycosyltransferase family 2 protein [Herpetosiphon sp.]